LFLFFFRSREACEGELWLWEAERTERTERTERARRAEEGRSWEQAWTAREGEELAARWV
jgi:hypothetical protein